LKIDLTFSKGKGMDNEKLRIKNTYTSSLNEFHIIMREVERSNQKHNGIKKIISVLGSSVIGIILSTTTVIATERISGQFSGIFSELIDNRFFLLFTSIFISIFIVILLSIIIYRLQQKKIKNRNILIEEMKLKEKDFLSEINDNISKILFIGAKNG